MNFAVFLHRNLAQFQRFFQESLQEIVWQFSIFFELFRDDFLWNVCGDGKGGIPVKSRCKCGNPDRDCTENTRFCSAMSTKSEIGAKMPLVTSSAAWAEIEMKRRVELFIPNFSSF